MLRNMLLLSDSKFVFIISAIKHFRAGRIWGTQTKWWVSRLQTVLCTKISQKYVVATLIFCYYVVQLTCYIPICTDDHLCYAQHPDGGWLPTGIPSTAMCATLPWGWHICCAWGSHDQHDQWREKRGSSSNSVYEGRSKFLSTNLCKLMSW